MIENIQVLCIILGVLVLFFTICDGFQIIKKPIKKWSIKHKKAPPFMFALFLSYPNDFHDYTPRFFLSYKKAERFANLSVSNSPGMLIAKIYNGRGDEVYTLGEI